MNIKICRTGLGWEINVGSWKFLSGSELIARPPTSYVILTDLSVFGNKDKNPVCYKDVIFDRVLYGITIMSNKSNWELDPFVSVEV